jgi:hypothetical protein
MFKIPTEKEVLKDLDIRFIKEFPLHTRSKTLQRMIDVSREETKAHYKDLFTNPDSPPEDKTA